MAVDYLALARTRADTPKKRRSFRRIGIYARNKKGKTRLLTTAGRDNMLIVDPEQGTDLMRELDPFVWPIGKWADTQEVYGALRTGKLSPNHIVQGESSTPFSWVSLDGLTRINNMALNYVRTVEEERDLDRPAGMIQQRDYGKSGDLMKQLIVNFCSLKMNVVLTAQEKMITDVGTYDDDEDAEPSEAFYVSDLPNAVRSLFNSHTEVVGRLYVVTVQNKKGEPVKQRRLQVGLHPKYDTGYRSEFVLPDIIRRPTLPMLAALMERGV